MKSMNRKAAIWLVLFIVISALVGQASVSSGSNDSVVTISSSGQIVIAPNLNVNFYVCSYSFSEYTNPSIIGTTYGLSQSWYAPQDANYATRIQQAKAANPNYKALIYRDIKHVYSYWTDEWNLAVANGWLLKDASGNYVVDTGYPTELYVADIGNKDYQQWVASAIKSWLDTYAFFDGVFADNGVAVQANDWGYYNSAVAINPRTNSPFTNTEIENAYVDTQNAIKTAIGSKMLICNGIWSGGYFYDVREPAYLDLLSRSNLDGIMSEGCWYLLNGQWETLDQWEASLRFTSQLQSYFGNKPNGAFVQSAWATGGLPTGATESQMALYGYCSALLTAQNDKNYVATVNLDNPPDADLLQLMQTLNGINVGQAQTDYSLISGTQVYTRDFQNVKVLVNPSSSTYNVPLSSPYHTINGVAVSGSYSIAPHTGVVLVKD
jgi:hypothetical protein